ncbi:GNAT family N-acetyltransferase [Vibrio sinaloensis]|nr:GNAT family N-acetyltransferase [Vibrio sinaloensis]
MLEYKCHQLLPLLICNANGDIIGRLNFTNVDLTKKRTAHVGYRVGKAYLSRGVAKTALGKGLIAMAEKGNQTRFFAYVDENNPASQKKSCLPMVLSKCAW